MSNWYVEVFEIETGEVVKRLGPMPEPKADKVYDGVSINLGEGYGVRVVEGER